MRSRYKKGYTLVEIMVVAGIFTIIASMALASYRSGSRDEQLKLAAQQVAAALRLAKSNAYRNASQEICDSDGSVCRSGSLCDSSYPTGCSSKYVWQYGIKFGVDLARTQYAIGADYNADGVYSAGETVPGGLLKLAPGQVFDSYRPDYNYDIVFAYNAASSSPFGCKGACVSDIVIRDSVIGHRYWVEYVSWADTYYSWLEIP